MQWQFDMSMWADGMQRRRMRFMRDWDSGGGEDYTQDPPETLPLSPIELNGRKASMVVEFEMDSVSPESKIYFTALADEDAEPHGCVRVELGNGPRLPPTADSSNFYYDGNVNVEALHREETLHVSPTEPAVWWILDFRSSPLSPKALKRTELTEVLARREGEYVVIKRIMWPMPDKCEVLITSLALDQVPMASINVNERWRLVGEWIRVGDTSCPEPSVTTALGFAKFRLMESVFHIPGMGFLYYPGGGLHYSGLKLVDQVEYATPALASLCAPGGDQREAVLNCLRLAAKRLECCDHREIQFSSIGGGDKNLYDELPSGAAATFVWGTAVVLLTWSDRRVTEEFWPHVRASCAGLLKDAGEDWLATQSEAPRRGELSLSAKCRAIIALDAAAKVARLLGVPESDAGLTIRYKDAAESIRSNVRMTFAARLSAIRADSRNSTVVHEWMYLAGEAGVAGAQESLKYLLEAAPNGIWVPRGVPVTEDQNLVLDAHVLCSIRCAFQHADSDYAWMRYLEYTKRMLECGPHPVDDNLHRRPVSSNSALYYRVVSEGIFGLRALGNGKFQLRPRLPVEWDRVSIAYLYLAGLPVDLTLDAASQAADSRSRCGTRTRTSSSHWEPRVRGSADGQTGYKVAYRTCGSSQRGAPVQTRRAVRVTAAVGVRDRMASDDPHPQGVSTVTIRDGYVFLHVVVDPPSVRLFEQAVSIDSPL